MLKLTCNHLNSIFLVGSTVYPAWCLCLSGSLVLCVRKEQTCVPPSGTKRHVKTNSNPCRDSATALHLLRCTWILPISSPTLLFVLSVHTLNFQVRGILLKVLFTSPDVPAVTCREVMQQCGSSCGFKLLLTFASFCQQEFNCCQCLPIEWKMDKLYELIRRWKCQRANKCSKVQYTYWKWRLRICVRHNPELKQHRQDSIKHIKSGKVKLNVR